MYARSINESEWIFLQDSKLVETRTRNQLIMNTRPSPVIIENFPLADRHINRTTREFMGTYSTSCD